MRRGALANVGVLGVALVLSIVTAEVVVRGFDLASAERQAALTGPGSSTAEPVAPGDRSISPLVPHPYRGWSHRVGQAGEPAGELFSGAETPWFRANNRTNQLGYYSSIDDYRTLAREDFVVAVFGGSVAKDMALVAGDELAAELERLRPELSGRVRVISAALGGYKQPQALFALGELLLLEVPLDVVINLDGVNEVALGNRYATQGFHPLYPNRDLLTAAIRLGQAAPTWDEIELMASYRRHRREAARWRERLARHPFAARSALVQTGVGLWVGHSEKSAASEETELRQRITHGTDQVANLPSSCPAEDLGCLPEIAELWRESSRAMAQLAAGHRVRYLHFLQPNQYVEGSKPLSEAEKASAFDPASDWCRGVRAGYPLLRAEGQELRADGIAFEDLTAIFKTQEATLYRDTCCHLDLEGNRQLARAVAGQIAGVVGSD